MTIEELRIERDSVRSAAVDAKLKATSLRGEIEDLEVAAVFDPTAKRKIPALEKEASAAEQKADEIEGRLRVLSRAIDVKEREFADQKQADESERRRAKVAWLRKEIPGAIREVLESAQQFEDAIKRARVLAVDSETVIGEMKPCLMPPEFVMPENITRILKTWAYRYDPEALPAEDPVRQALEHQDRHDQAERERHERDRLTRLEAANRPLGAEGPGDPMDHLPVEGGLLIS